MELTKAEEQVMHIMWEIERGVVHEVIEHFPDPKPAYTTISTLIRILEKKGFVSYKAYGKTHEYFPIVSRSDYSKNQSKKVLSQYFNGSLQNMVSFFVQEEEISVKELEKILQDIKKKDS